MLKVDASDLALTREALYRTLSLERAASGTPPRCRVRPAIPAVRW